MESRGSRTNKAVGEVWRRLAVNINTYNKEFTKSGLWLCEWEWLPRLTCLNACSPVGGAIWWKFRRSGLVRGSELLEGFEILKTGHCHFLSLLSDCGSVCELSPYSFCCHAYLFPPFLCFAITDSYPFRTEMNSSLSWLGYSILSQQQKNS